MLSFFLLFKSSLFKYPIYSCNGSVCRCLTFAGIDNYNIYVSEAELGVRVYQRAISSTSSGDTEPCLSLPVSVSSLVYLNGPTPDVDSEILNLLIRMCTNLLNGETEHFLKNAWGMFV